MYILKLVPFESLGTVSYSHFILTMAVSFERGVYSDTTQLNSTDPVEQRTASQSCFCLWRHDLQTESTVVHAVELSSVEFNWVELCRYKYALSYPTLKNGVTLKTGLSAIQSHWKLHHLKARVWFSIRLMAISFARYGRKSKNNYLTCI